MIKFVSAQLRSVNTVIDVAAIKFRSGAIKLVENLIFDVTYEKIGVARSHFWYLYGLRECLMPAFQYFLETSANDAIVSLSIRVFQAVQSFNLRVVKTSTLVAADVDQIRAVPFLNDDNMIQSLKDELPAYLVMVGTIPDDFDALVDT